MATLLKLGPADHGRRMTYKEFMSGDYREGHRYELIDGRLYVSPFPEVAESVVASWLFGVFMDYSQRRPDSINWYSTKPRVCVPGAPIDEATAAEPDFAAYHNLRLCDRSLNWPDVSPVLVAEVLIDGDPNKDLVRNVELYWRVPGVREYWVLDGRADVMRPELTVYRRSPGRWSVRTVAGGGRYETPELLPEFTLDLVVRF